MGGPAAGQPVRARERGVAFDVIGTLFDLSPLRERLDGLGAPPAALQAWLGRLLHAATALTLAGEFRPFQEPAERTLRSLLAQLELPPDGADEVPPGLAELPPFPEAGTALDTLAAAGVAMIALTNGGELNTRTLLRTAGLDRHIQDVVATEHVRTCGTTIGPLATTIQLPA